MAKIVKTGYPIEKTLKVKLGKMGLYYHKASHEESIMKKSEIRTDNVFWNSGLFTPEKVYETIAIDQYEYSDGGKSLCYLIINDEGQMIHSATTNWEVVS